MAKNETKFLTPHKLKKDSAALAAIAALPDYKSIRTDYTLAKLQAAGQVFETAQTAFNQTSAEYEAARDNYVAAQWARHNLLLGAKEQVIAQYGNDSNEKQALGLTKKSERAKPVRKAKKAA